MSIEDYPHYDTEPIPRTPLRLKCLCVCLRGNVRSVALAYLIKLIYGHEAIAVGIAETTEKTREMLYTWADQIFLLDDSLKIQDKILPEYWAKVTVIDVGPDIWFDPYHHELQHKLLKQIGSLNL